MANSVLGIVLSRTPDQVPRAVISADAIEVPGLLVVILWQAAIRHKNKPMHFEAVTLPLAVDSHGQCDAVISTVDLALKNPDQSRADGRNFPILSRVVAAEVGYRSHGLSIDVVGILSASWPCGSRD